jgi:hypothetical protein
MCLANPVHIRIHTNEDEPWNLALSDTVDEAVNNAIRWKTFEFFSQPNHSNEVARLAAARWRAAIASNQWPGARFDHLHV